MQFRIWIQEIKIWIWNQDFAYNSNNFGPICVQLGEVMPDSTSKNWLNIGEDAILDLDPGDQNVDPEPGFYL